MGIEDMVRRNLERAGEACTLTVYQDTGQEDDYGDPSFTESTTQAVALFRKPQRPPGEGSGAGGVERVADATVYLSTEHRDSVHSAGTSTPRATMITRTRTGEDYHVVDVWDEGNGQFRLDCVRSTEIG